jgi:hypothetical protein
MAESLERTMFSKFKRDIIFIFGIEGDHDKSIEKERERRNIKDSRMVPKFVLHIIVVIWLFMSLVIMVRDRERGGGN